MTQRTPLCAPIWQNASNSTSELFPWDHPNYGMDEAWVRSFPYEQHVKPGETVQLDVVFTNHSNEAREAKFARYLPEVGGWCLHRKSIDRAQGRGATHV